MQNALAAYFARQPTVSQLDYSSSDDDDLPRVIHAHAAQEMTLRNGQPLLSGTTEDYTHIWFEAEKAQIMRSVNQKIPDASMYLDLMICDCEPNSLAESTFEAFNADRMLLQDPAITAHDGTAAEPQTDEQKRQACLAILALVKALFFGTCLV